jgi:PadR family transcriptional regulator PadR
MADVSSSVVFGKVLSLRIATDWRGGDEFTGSGELKYFSNVVDIPCRIMYVESMLSRELVAASTRPLLLSLLAEGESYGYELIQRVKELSGGELHWTEGMLYPVLHRLEDEGLIESQWKESEAGRKRKYYRLTKPGGKALKTERDQWLFMHQTLNTLWNPTPASI